MVEDDYGELLHSAVKGEAEAMVSPIETQKRESCQVLIHSEFIPQLKTCNTSNSVCQEMPSNSNGEGEEENLYDVSGKDTEVGAYEDLKNDVNGSFDDFESGNCTVAQSGILKYWQGAML